MKTLFVETSWSQPRGHTRYSTPAIVLSQTGFLSASFNKQIYHRVVLKKLYLINDSLFRIRYSIFCTSSWRIFTDALNLSFFTTIMYSRSCTHIQVHQLYFRPFDRWWLATTSFPSMSSHIVMHSRTINPLLFATNYKQKSKSSFEFLLVSSFCVVSSTF